MLSYVFEADTQCWKPRNIFVNLSCSRWSVGNSDTFIFAATKCWGEKGHFQHRGFLHVFNYLYIVSWVVMLEPKSIMTVLLNPAHSVSWAMAALCFVTESSALETVIKTSPGWAVRLMQGVSCCGQRGKHTASQISCAIRKWGVGDDRVSGREQRWQPGGFLAVMGLFFPFPRTGRNWDCSSVGNNVLCWVFLSGGCHVLFSGSCFELSSALTCHKQQQICSEPGLLPALGKAEGKPTSLAGFGAKHTNILLAKMFVASC